MIVIPAVDIYDGAAVRAARGREDALTYYSGRAAGGTLRFESPAEAADHWVAEGAERLHVVDLEGAMRGGSRNEGRVLEILRRHPGIAEVGGGIRTEKVARAYLEAGAWRIILGTRAFREPGFLASLSRSHPGRVAAGIDSRGGRVALSGWKETAEAPIEEFAARAEGEGAAAIVLTDTGRDGTLEGPDVAVVERLLSRVSVPVVFAGGIASVGDIRALTRLPLEGVVIGKALYEGRLCLKNALRAASAPVRRNALTPGKPEVTR